MGVIDSLPAELGVARHRFTADEYERMAEVGLLNEDSHVELIEGVIVDTARITPRHASTVTRLNRALFVAVGDRAIVAVHDPVRLNNFSEPRPDLALLKRRDDFYAKAHPGPADVLLLIEVSQTSAAYDRDIKLPLYAAHGICEVWIVDLDANVVRFHRRPLGRSFLEVTSTESPGPTPAASLPGVSIDLTGVLE